MGKLRVSVRGVVFFLASLHLYFAVTHLIRIVPRAVSSMSNLAAVMTLVFALMFFSSGFMTFRGADEESPILIRLGGLLLLIISTQRLLICLLSSPESLRPPLPEGDFLRAYPQPVAIIFASLLYISYLTALWGYWRILSNTQTAHLPFLRPRDLIGSLHSESDSLRLKMCCSIRACVFFLASLHIYFAVTQLVGILPTALSSLSERALEAALAVVFAFFFFSSGFMTFRGADEESSVLVGGGGVLLFFILGERFILMYFDLLLNPTLPEGDFLNVYGKTVPVIFTVLLYLFYLAILFIYHNELKHSSASSSPTHLPHRPNGQCSPRHLPGAPDSPATPP